jgi:hypothetical protein
MRKTWPKKAGELTPRLSVRAAPYPATAGRFIWHEVGVLDT